LQYQSNLDILLDLAKTSPHVLSPELFATHIGVFLLSRYSHLTKAFIDVERLKWSRIIVGEHAIGQDAQPNVLKAEDGGHRHSFQRDGDEKHVASLTLTKVGIHGQAKYEVEVTSGISDLLSESIFFSLNMCLSNPYVQSSNPLAPPLRDSFAMSLPLSWK